jgi:hypothetical protein
MAMTAQEYLDTFNAAINAGAYDSAANILKAAEGDFGPGVYDVAGVVLEANPNLPQEIDYMSPQGIQSIRDYVASVPAPVASYGPPSPAVSPVVSNPVSLTPAGIAALAPSANVSSPANVFSPADYGPPSPPPAAPPTASPAEIQRMQAQRAEAELLRLREAERPIVDPRPQPTVDPVAQKYVNDFNALIDQGNYDGAARLVKEAELAGYGDEAYRAAAVALDANTNLPPELNFLNAEGIASIKSFVEEATRPPPPPPAATVVKSFDEQLNELANQNFGRSLTASEMDTYRRDYGGELNDANINDFLKRSQKEIDQVKTARDIATKATDTAAANAEGRPGPGQIFGIPRFERQTQSNVPFAPLRRGLAQLRPAMYMPGLTSGQAPLGGSGFTPESLRTANQGLSPADRAYQMDVGGVSPAELSAAIGTPVGQLQAEYNQSRPRGLFSTGVPAPRGLPEDFVLQTGAYGAPTPTFFTPTPAKTTSPSGSSSANANQPGSIGGSGGDGEGIEGDPNSSGIEAGSTIANAISAIAPGFADSLGISPGFTNEAGGFSQGPSGASEGDSEASQSADGNSERKTGGLIRMAEGGGPPKMTELSVEDLGSTFDISKYIDDEGRLVGGYSKPIYDENRVITGYDYRPYERDVVFGKELRDKEAAMQLTDAEREQMMIEMAMRQGRTGISPTTGGLAGISANNLMPSYMRRQPQYYSPAEQFRPRYAEGGNVSSTAQDLASRGRGGDTMLVHMAPHEVAGLNAIARMQGTELTINPETGMPEALKLGKLFKTLAPFIPFIPGVGQFLAPAFGALGMGGFSPLLQKAITSGIVGGFTGPKGGFDLQRGLMQGITAYGLGSLQQNLAGPSTPGGPPAPTGPAVSPELGAVDASVTSQNPLAGMEYMNTPVTGGNPLEGSQFINTIQTPGDITAASQAAEATRAGFPDQGVSDLGAPFEYQAVSPKNAATTASGMKTPTALLTTGLGLSSTADYDKLTSAGIAVKREKEEEDELYRRLFERSLGAVPVRSGGLMKLAGGGMTYMEAGGTTGPTGAPREVVGNGDGMSDSVPADIEGVQEARLADGEFVIPADVVADIGNGSSDAGSKKLYDMMDRVRKARHGTTEQPPEIKAERLMPA